MHNILDYGASRDGQTLSTHSFQSAVDACRSEGGGVVYVPFGTYVTATVVLCSNVHFVFEPGTVILGPLDPDVYHPREQIDYPLYQDASHSYVKRSMFVAENCENISFAGRATIDMRDVWENTPVAGESAWTSRRGAKIFAFKECRQIRLSDMTLLHATDVAVYLAGCENVAVRGLTLDVNIDGISPDCCKNVMISDCGIRSGDDAIVLKTSYVLNRKCACENIAISNCVVSSRCNAIKIGTETNGDFRNITINNCTIYNTYYGGVSVESTDGANIDGVVISNITMQNVGSPIFVILSDRGRGPEGTSIGSMRNVVIDNITASGPYVSWKAPQLSHLAQKDHVCMADISPCTITGQPYRKIESICLSNIYLTVPGGGTEEERDVILPEITKLYPQNVSFGDRFPVYGMFFRHISSLTMNNVNVTVLREDKREAFCFDDVDNIL